ncbi:hypothetical protein KU6B_03300 [Mameliella alba]|uniref:T4SS efffector SepA family protein n=1 Tax=Mameliella alba TaxID=561184 RepID=UPI0013E46292|nr:hypothetical protein [Mameliella alba]BBU54065.1 hypothetical protein KU6B_03300 [Mameliella alba]
MMPVVRINDATFADLSALKTWFGTKTPSETIDRIVREAMDQLGMERDDEPHEALHESYAEAMEFPTAPGLSFTKPINATVGGKSVQNPKWSSILLAVIAQVKGKGLGGDKLVNELHIPAKATEYDEEGYKYQPDLGISVQGQSANDAWKEIERIAQKWHIPVMVKFMWRQNPKAQYPGKMGVLRAGQ